MLQGKLYRSRKNRLFAGVCGGIGEYFGIDPTLVRLAFVLASIFLAALPGLTILYLIMMFIVPDEPA